MPEPRPESGSWEGLVAQLESGQTEAGVAEFETDSRVRLQMILGERPIETMSEFLDTYEINVAKGMLSADEQELAGLFAGLALQSENPTTFIQTQLQYEEGSQGLIAVLTFPGFSNE